MRAVKGLGAIAVAALAAWTFLTPAAGAWAFTAAELVFFAWLTRVLRNEAASPELMHECASALAATGLASLVLVPWLTYKLQWLQAILIGVMLFAVGALTRRESRREGGRDE
jgi:ABC-type Fe3+-siderophore transport system permease subunit